MNQKLVKLPNSFISIIGQDSERFLQGQCSADLSELSTDQFTYGTLNTPKGRMYALFKVIRIENGLLLSLHESTADHALQTLQKYAVFFKCELSKATYYAYGGDLEQKAEFLNLCPIFEELFDPENSSSKKGDSNKSLLKLPGEQKLFELWSSEELSDAAETENANWLAREAIDGIPQIFSNTIEQFILQELNLQELGAVSFKKGCYTGQEIIARMKFLGKLKKRIFLLQSTSDADINFSPGEDVFIKSDEGDAKKAGKAVRIHRLNENTLIALAVLNKELLTEDNIAFISDKSEIEFSIQELSYTKE